MQQAVLGIPLPIDTTSHVPGDGFVGDDDGHLLVRRDGALRDAIVGGLRPAGAR